MKKEERFYEKLVLALLILGTGFLYYNAATAKIVSPDSDMASMDFPKGILIILAVLCIGKIITTCITSAKEHSLDDESRIFVDRRTWMTAISIIIYAILWNVIGFCLSSFLFFYAEALILKKDANKKYTALISIGVTMFIFVIFGVAFGVDFPEPLLELFVG